MILFLLQEGQIACLRPAQTYPVFPGASRILFLEGFQPFQDGLTSFLRTHPPHTRHISLLHFLAQAKAQGPQQGQLQAMLCPWCHSDSLATLSGMTEAQDRSHRTPSKRPALASVGEHPVLRLQMNYLKDPKGDDFSHRTLFLIISSTWKEKPVGLTWPTPKSNSNLVHSLLISSNTGEYIFPECSL